MVRVLITLSPCRGNHPIACFRNLPLLPLLLHLARPACPGYQSCHPPFLSRSGLQRPGN